jgi:hypothetical protein
MMRKSNLHTFNKTSKSPKNPTLKTLIEKTTTPKFTTKDNINILTLRNKNNTPRTIITIEKTA